MNILKQNKHTLFMFIALMQPIIDLITALTTYYFSFNLTIGAFTRLFLLCLLLNYVAHHLYKERKLALGLFIFALTMIGGSFGINFVLKHPFYPFEELNFLFKTLYYFVLVWFTLILSEKNLFSSAFIGKVVHRMGLIVSGSYWIAFLTQTSLPSYSFEKTGYAGWFFAANELSVIVIILFSFSTIQLLQFPNKFPHWLSFLLLLCMGPMIGTKTAFFGIFILLIAGVARLLMDNQRKSWRAPQLAKGMISVLLFVSIIPFSPMVENTTNVHLSTEKEKLFLETREDPKIPAILQRVLSSRDFYFSEVYAQFDEAPPIRKIFGLGYAGDYQRSIQMIEMDFFDLFFSFGFLGSLCLLTPFFILLFKVFQKGSWKNSIFLLLNLTLGICLGISFLAGHVFFAPSVMTYMVLLLLMLFAINHQTNQVVKDE